MHVTNADNYAQSTAKSMGIVVYGIVIGPLYTRYGPITFACI